MTDRERIAALRTIVSVALSAGEPPSVIHMREALDGWDRALDEAHNWHNKADGWLEVARKAEDERDEARDLVQAIRDGRAQAADIDARLREWGMS